MYKGGKKIRDNKYIILIVVNIIFGLTILYLLYTNLNNQQTAPANKNVDRVESSSISITKENMIKNGDFEQGGLGWNNIYALREEKDGNHYIINNNNWLIKQDINLLSGAGYNVQASTKKGTAEGPARISLIFFDTKNQKLPEYYDIQHMHQGNDWEEVNRFISIPANAAKTRIYLLTDDKKGFHCFDNIQITQTVK